MMANVIATPSTPFPLSAVRLLPGPFKDAHPVPVSVIRGKERVEVRFQAHPGKTAGRIFNCTLMPRGA